MSKEVILDELPFSVAVKKYPAIKNIFPLPMLLDFATDDNYIVRISNKRLEIGYKEDQWFLGDDDD